MNAGSWVLITWCCNAWISSKIINYYKWEALINFLREREKRKGKKRSCVCPAGSRTPALHASFQRWRHFHVTTLIVFVLTKWQCTGTSLIRLFWRSATNRKQRAILCKAKRYKRTRSVWNPQKRVARWLGYLAKCDMHSHRNVHVPAFQRKSIQTRAAYELYKLGLLSELCHQMGSRGFQ